MRNTMSDYAAKPEKRLRKRSGSRSADARRDYAGLARGDFKLSVGQNHVTTMKARDTYEGFN